MRQALYRCRLLLILVLIAQLLRVGAVNAQAGSANDLINGVNNLRQSHGLAPYTIDSYLMGYAQSHSDYMAARGSWTHTRADGTTAFDHGIKENVAVGSSMTIQHLIHNVWGDWVHWQTMVGFAGGRVGAGVAAANGTVYYTLNVIPEGGSTNIQPAAFAQEEPPNTPTPVYTSTPDQFGAIIHIVQPGDSLWSIATRYGITIQEMLENSGFPETKTNLIVGERLIIVPAEEPTTTPTITETPEPGTATPTQPRPTLTPLPTRTPAPTATPTSPPSLIARTLGDTTSVGLGLAVLSGLGLLLVVYLGFLKKS